MHSGGEERGQVFVSRAKKFVLKSGHSTILPKTAHNTSTPFIWWPDRAFIFYGDPESFCFGPYFFVGFSCPLDTSSELSQMIEYCEKRRRVDRFVGVFGKLCFTKDIQNEMVWRVISRERDVRVNNSVLLLRNICMASTCCYCPSNMKSHVRVWHKSSPLVTRFR